MVLLRALALAPRDLLSTGIETAVTIERESERTTDAETAPMHPRAGVRARALSDDALRIPGARASLGGPSLTVEQQASKKTEAIVVSFCGFVLCAVVLVLGSVVLAQNVQVSATTTAFSALWCVRAIDAAVCDGIGLNTYVAEYNVNVTLCGRCVERAVKTPPSICASAFGVWVRRSPTIPSTGACVDAPSTVSVAAGIFMVAFASTCLIAMACLCCVLWCAASQSLRSRACERRTPRPPAAHSSTSRTCATQEVDENAEKA